MQEDDKFCIYTQAEGIEEEGTYRRDGDTLFFASDEGEREAVCTKDRILVAEEDSIVTFAKDSDLELFINVKK